jgi:hypothetical protein
MNPGDIKLGPLGQEIELTAAMRKVTPLPQEIVMSKRTVSGKLVEEVVRKYVNLQIDYEIMLGPDHETLEGLYNLDQHLNCIVMDRLGNQTSATVKMTWTPGERESIAGEWFWNGVSLTLEVV